MALSNWQDIRGVSNSERAVKNVNAKVTAVRLDSAKALASVTREIESRKRARCNCKDRLLSLLPGRGDLSKGEKERFLAIIAEVMS